MATYTYEMHLQTFVDVCYGLRDLLCHWEEFNDIVTEVLRLRSTEVFDGFDEFLDNLEQDMPGICLGMIRKVAKKPTSSTALRRMRQVETLSNLPIRVHEQRQIWEQSKSKYAQRLN